MTIKAKDIRRVRQSAWERQAKRRRWIIAGAWISAGLAFAAMLVYVVWKDTRPIPRTGADIAVQLGQHIAVGEPHDPYNSDPPTSGPHYEQPADAGFYNEAPVDEQLVHNLEHGYVILWYNCSDRATDLCDQLKSQIRAAMQSAGNSPRTNTPKLIAIPRSTLAGQVALTTWGRLDVLESFDRQRILNFIRVFRDRAPEPNAS